ncbi:MAG: amine dehydrogenase large subunit [Pseudohongiellaceae bacterium]
MTKRLVFTLVMALWAASLNAQQWDSVTGETREVGITGPHWFSVRSSGRAHLIDGDTGRVGGMLNLSDFSPAVRPSMERGVIYAYGSYYTRNVYGDRTDVVIGYDTATTLPVTEIEIPAKAAGIGHSGMIGLIDNRFIGVWNITPGISVSIVDVENDEFVGEISTPQCAGVYQVDSGFISACADGRVQFVELDDQGMEASRIRSDVFFDVAEDPVFDYAVPAGEGWMFVTLEGLVYEVTVNAGSVMVSGGWSINPPDSEIPDRNGIAIEPDDNWRIGGRQPFAYNHDIGVFAAVMHEGGGQETFEDAGSEIWVFSTATQRRGYRLAIDGGDVRSVQMTQDDDPLMLISAGSDIQIRNPQTGALIRTVEDVSGLVQNLYFD